LKEILNKFINKMATINNRSYDYFQGYHDIGLFFILLFIDEFEVAVTLFQRFSEFYIKENLTKFDDKTCNYSFNSINSILMEILKNLNLDVMNTIKDVCYEPHFVFPWILTFFTHNVTNTNKQFRMFDYIITTHPLAIYYITALILIDEVTYLKENNPELV
jgi:hypothetical protein